MAPVRGTSPRHSLPVRNLLAASAGNAVEWFDWTIFALFATFFAPQFFPADNPTLAYLYTALTFALALLFRPPVSGHGERSRAAGSARRPRRDPV